MCLVTSYACYLVRTNHGPARMLTARLCRTWRHVLANIGCTWLARGQGQMGQLRRECEIVVLSTFVHVHVHHGCAFVRSHTTHVVYGISMGQHVHGAVKRGRMVYLRHLRGRHHRLAKALGQGRRGGKAMGSSGTRDN